MSRKKSSYKRHQILADSRYHDKTLSRFINYLMKDGKKAKAENIVYASFNIIEQRMQNESPLSVFHQAIQNVSPILEVKSRRVGGSTYMSPVEPREARKLILAMRWLVQYARARSEYGMANKLAEELMDAFHSRGPSIKKKEDLFKMAEANRVFAVQKRVTQDAK